MLWAPQYFQPFLLLEIRLVVMFFDQAAYYSAEGGIAVWLKIIIGAAAGLIVGHWVPPGYAVWALIGVVLGALADIVLNRYLKKEKEQE